MCIIGGEGGVQHVVDTDGSAFLRQIGPDDLLSLEASEAKETASIRARKIMDIEALNAGQEFEELPETYTIFVTENDFFGKGVGLYPIGRMNLATQSPFNDREHIIYVNGQYNGDDDLGRLMHDFLCNDPDDMHFDILAERSRYFKENPEGVSEMCKAMEDMRNEALERGRAEGRLNSLAESVKNLKDKLGFTDQQAKDTLNISNEEWDSIALKV